MVVLVDWTSLNVAAMENLDVLRISYTLHGYTLCYPLYTAYMAQSTIATQDGSSTPIP